MKRFCYIALLLTIPYGCIDEFDIVVGSESTASIEDILVVEAIITDELKTQEILLSRGNTFGNDSIPNFESNALIIINDEMGNTFRFSEQELGRYVSEVPFAAQNGVEYQLSITTSSGEEFQSSTQMVVGSSSIDEFYAQRITSDAGVEGMAIYVDSSNPTGNLNDYRYTYEETYKIIAPNWTPFEFEIIRDQQESVFDPLTGEFIETLFPDVSITPRKQEEQTCFNTVLSNDIILSDGTAVDGSSVQGNLVRFINRSDPIISHRYSILIKQFLQSVEAAKFYRTLLQFSQNENLFSEVQPGFLEGNVSAVNSEALVIGFFSAASVTERRYFFNYEDFFPGEPLPPYFDGLNCSTPFSPQLGNPERDGPYDIELCGPQRPLTDYIRADEIEYFGESASPPPICDGPYLVTVKACGDCTALGSNIVPEFWIDE